MRTVTANGLRQYFSLLCFAQHTRYLLIKISAIICERTKIVDLF